MNLISGKMFVGATLALSLSAIAFPVCAASSTSSVSPKADRAISMQLAQEEHHDLNETEHHEMLDKATDKAAGKAHEANAEVTGAAHAVRKAHRHHEATEGMHHTMSSKVDAKIDEAHDEVKGAADSVKATHDAHEAAEGH